MQFQISTLLIANGLLLSSHAQAAVHEGLVNCGNFMNLQENCVAQAGQLEGVQPVHSTFHIDYTMTCNPGIPAPKPSSLRISTTTENGQMSDRVIYYKNSESYSIDGYGPVILVDQQPNDLKNKKFQAGCFLSVNVTTEKSAQAIAQEAAIAIALAQKLSDDLASKKVEAAAWSRVLTMTATNHAAFIQAGSGAFSILISHIEKLSDMFGANNSMQAIIESGGEPARQLLSNAVVAASENGAFELQGIDPFQYLEANLPTILAHKLDSTTIPAASLVPNMESCHNLGLCKKNVQDYIEAKEKISSIILDAESLISQSGVLTKPNWIEIDRLIVN